MFVFSTLLVEYLQYLQGIILVHQHGLEFHIWYLADGYAELPVDLVPLFLLALHLQNAFSSQSKHSNIFCVVFKLSTLDLTNDLVAVQLAHQRHLPSSLPLIHCSSTHEASLDDLMCISCLLPWNVVAHLELVGNCFNDQVVFNSPIIQLLTRQILVSFFVWVQLKPVVAHLWLSIEINWPRSTATPMMLCPVPIPTDPAAPGALPHLLLKLVQLRR